MSEQLSPALQAAKEAYDWQNKNTKLSDINRISPIQAAANAYNEKSRIDAAEKSFNKGLQALEKGNIKQAESEFNHAEKRGIKVGERLAEIENSKREKTNSRQGQNQQGITNEQSSLNSSVFYGKTPSFSIGPMEAGNLNFIDKNVLPNPLKGEWTAGSWRVFELCNGEKLALWVM